MPTGAGAVPSTADLALNRTRPVEVRLDAIRPSALHSKVNPVERPNLLVACLALALPLVAISQDALAAGTQSRSERGKLVRQIVLKWGGYVRRAYRADVRNWANGMTPVFTKASLDSLRRIADARTFDQRNNELLARSGTPDAVPAGVAKTLPDTAAKLFGDADKDLIFVPITPCRIIDRATRWLWTYNHERPNMALGGIMSMQRLTRAA